MVGYLKSYGIFCNIDMDEIIILFFKWNFKCRNFFIKVKNVKKNFLVCFELMICRLLMYI